MPIVGQFGSLAGFGVFPGGALESIATVTLSSAASNIEFTSIPSTYQHLQVRMLGRTNRADTFDYFQVQLNGDTASNYASHQLWGDGASAQASARTTSDNNQDMRLVYALGASAGSSRFAAMILDVLDYGSTTKNKTARAFIGGDNNGSGAVSIISGLWLSTSAVTSLKVYPISGNSWVQYTTAALYGVKAP
jgi:hypothetical protein